MSPRRRPIPFPFDRGSHTGPKPLPLEIIIKGWEYGLSDQEIDDMLMEIWGEDVLDDG